jgi:hypothetical protein
VHHAGTFQHLDVLGQAFSVIENASANTPTGSIA